jgi:prepilin-type N-terminal cleavage/methylation domain-containing protein
MTPDRRAGLTLIEVILATAILGVGIATLVAATGRCLAVARKAREYEVARRLIGQVDLEVPIQFEELEEGEESGDFEDPFEDYRWTREIVEVFEEDLEMFEVRTTVSWSDKQGPASESVVTYIYGPTYPRRTTGEVEQALP